MAGKDKYDLAEYWRRLDNALKAANAKFNSDADEFAAQQAYAQTIDEDEKALLLQQLVLNHMLKLGLQIEQIGKGWSDISGQTRGAIGKQLDQLASRFGPTEIPHIKGAKSLKFAEEVYYQHMRNFDNVHFNAFLKKLAKLFVGIDIDKRQENAARQANDLNSMIQAFRADSPKPKPLLIRTGSSEPGHIEIELKTPSPQSSTITIDTQLTISMQRTNSRGDRLAQLKKPLLKYDENEFDLEVIYTPSPKLLQYRSLTPQHKSDAPLTPQSLSSVNLAADDKAQIYKDRLLAYVNKVMNKDEEFLASGKGKYLEYIKDELELKEKGFFAKMSLEQMKEHVKDLRNIVSKHRDTGIVGFFKCTWARNTRTYNELNNFFEEENNNIKLP